MSKGRWIPKLQRGLAAGAGCLEHIPRVRLRDRDEDSYDIGIELRAAALDQARNCLCMGYAPAVAAIRDHSIVGIDDGDNSRNQRNVSSLEARRIASAIDALVVMQCVQAGFFEARKQTQNRPAVFRVAVDDRALFPG